MSFNIDERYSKMNQGEVLLAYKGSITAELITNVLGVVESKLDHVIDKSITKKKIFDLFAHEKAWVIAQHFPPFPSLGLIEQKGNKWKWNPVIIDFPEFPKHQIRIVITDAGPGILDIEKAMQPGFSTAPGWVRELGFGAGMGLPNIKKFTDEMSIKSTVESGTQLEIIIKLSNYRNED